MTSSRAETERLLSLPERVRSAVAAHLLLRTSCRELSCRTVSLTRSAPFRVRAWKQLGMGVVRRLREDGRPGSVASGEGAGDPLEPPRCSPSTVSRLRSLPPGSPWYARYRWVMPTWVLVREASGSRPSPTTLLAHRLFAARLQTTGAASVKTTRSSAGRDAYAQPLPTYGRATSTAIAASPPLPDSRRSGSQRRRLSRGRRSAPTLTFVQIGAGRAGSGIGSAPLPVWTTSTCVWDRPCHTSARRLSSSSR